MNPHERRVIEHTLQRMIGKRIVGVAVDDWDRIGFVEIRLDDGSKVVVKEGLWKQDGLEVDGYSAKEGE